MTDDPRDILKAAGVECAEVEAWAEQVFTGEFSEMKTASEALSIIGPLREVVVTSNAAILAVALGTIAPLGAALLVPGFAGVKELASIVRGRMTTASRDTDLAAEGPSRG